MPEHFASVQNARGSNAARIQDEHDGKESTHGWHTEPLLFAVHSHLPAGCIYSA